VRTTLLFVALAAGCLGTATTNNQPQDLSATVLVDLSTQASVDSGGGDAFGDGGPLYNCGQLNTCEIACASDAKPQMCITGCRNKASASALTKEMTLQGCFNQYCPQSTDAGAAAICTRNDMGAFSSACTMCITNSQIAPANACTGGAECHMCYTDAEACVNDK
jgi:hypothetical protein